MLTCLKCGYAWEPRITGFEVLSVGAWYPCKIAAPQPSGWLHYELRDHTNGLARPGTWRETAPKECPACKSRKWATQKEVAK